MVGNGIGLYRALAGAFWLAVSGVALLVVVAALRHELRDLLGLFL